MSADKLSDVPDRLTGTFRDYIAIARPDHWVKHVFILPGIAIALVLAPWQDPAWILARVALGFASACLIASANYVINEWLDAEYDKHHPQKHLRPAAQGRLRPSLIYLEYVLLVAAGLLCASVIDRLFLFASAIFVVSGLFYNVPPLRTKDRVFLDVLSEAINNPIRLVLGWSMVSATTVPPLSLFGAFWMGGAFLMAAKRLSEYRSIVEQKGPDGPALYRRSFKFYTVESLIISCFVYAVMATFLVAVFLIKYRVEYIFSLPFIALLFGYYLHLGLKSSSVAQRPEALHRDRKLVLIVSGLIALMCILSVVDMPSLERLVQSTFMELPLE
jgi:4-hydroxybenzoate polyprenyltransferase